MLKPRRCDMGTWDYFPYVSKFIYLRIHYTTHTRIEREKEKKREKKKREEEEEEKREREREKELRKLNPS